MTRAQYDQILADKDFPKGYFAKAVLDGRQRLSGADLAGKARRYSMWYMRQIRRVLAVCARYGVYETVTRHNKRILPPLNT